MKRVAILRAPHDGRRNANDVKKTGS